MYWQTEPGVPCPAIRILQFVNRMEIGRIDPCQPQLLHGRVD
jgi:hypothetical protein